MSLTITFTGAESVVQRRAALNALVAYAAAFNDIGADAPDFGKQPAPAAPPPLVVAETPAPVPPAAAVFTAPPAPAAAPPMPEVELDSEGQPWNAELHASTKAKIADGTWRKKRGATPEAPPAAPPAPAPAAVAPPAAPPAPAAPAAPTKTTFATFMANVMPLIKAGKIAGLRINELCQTQGVANMGMASSASADQLDTIWALIQAEPGVL
jgi:hypothetical protein